MDELGLAHAGRVGQLLKDLVPAQHFVAGDVEGLAQCLAVIGQ